MKSMSRFLMACSLFSAAQVAFATTVERFRPYAVDVSEGATWPGALSADSQAGAYGKTGGGELTFPLGSVLMRNAFTFNLWEGSLKLTDDGTSPSVDTTTPPVVMNSAALWLEAGVNYGWKDEVAGTVETWYDRREANESGTFGSSYPRAKATASNSKDAKLKAVVYAQAQTAGDGKKRLYFNGRGNAGSTMRIHDKTGAASAVSVVTVFAVHENRGGNFGWLLGHTDAAPFHTGNEYYFGAGAASTTTHAGRFFKNGVLCDGGHAAVEVGRHLIEWEAGSAAQSFNCIFDDRGYAGRAGGDDICEFVVFKSRLSDVDRLAVEEYLMQKWIGKSRAPSYAVRTAKDTAIAYNADTAAAVQGVKLSGAGTLVKTGSADMTIPLRGSGELSAYEGRIRVAEGNATVEAASLDYVFKGGDNVSATVDATAAATYDTVAFANGAAGDAKTVEVAGDASVRISGDFPAGVETLKFSGRELVLSDAFDPDFSSAPAKPVEVTIANPGFEGLTTKAVKDWASGKWGGWTITGGTQGTQHLYIFDPTRVGESGYSYIADPNVPAPEGNYVLGIRYDGSFSTQIVIPEDGVYDLTFKTSSRSGYGAGTFEMSLTDSENVKTVFGHVTATYCAGFVPRRFSTGFVKAGTYTLAFKGLNAFDHIAHFDDFRMVRSAASDDSHCRIPVPNGDFEVATPSVQGQALSLRTGNAAEGWTLTQTAAGDSVNNTDVAITLCGSSYYNMAHALRGNGMLAFYGDGGTATTAEFTYPEGTLPAGKYRLRFDLCAWGSDYSWRLTNRAYAPSIGATLTVNGVDHDLGTSGQYGYLNFVSITLPNAVDLDGTETLQLKIRQKTATSGQNFAAGLVDNLVLERVGFSSANLIANGTFEGGFSSSWGSARGNVDSDPYLKNGNVFTRDVASDQWKNIYGSDIANGCGQNVLFLVQQARIWQTVDFPAAGTYRLEFFARARPNYGGNAVHAFLGTSAGEVVQEIGTTAPTYSPRFLRQSFVFDVAEPGQKTLVLKGVNGTGSIIARNGNGGNQADSNIALDGVTLTAVRRVESFAIDENVELKLAAGTKLRLDFEGSRTVKTLKIGGTRLVGRVDASHASGLVSGTGALVGLPSDKGAVLILK